MIVLEAEVNSEEVPESYAKVIRRQLADRQQDSGWKQGTSDAK